MTETETESKGERQRERESERERESRLGSVSGPFIVRVAGSFG